MSPKVMVFQIAALICQNTSWPRDVVPSQDRPKAACPAAANRWSRRDRARRMRSGKEEDRAESGGSR